MVEVPVGSLTPGVDTYITTRDAFAYFSDRLYADQWIGAVWEDKEKALKMARRLIDSQSFKGHRASESQLLAWPRIGVLDESGYPVPSDTVPFAVIAAQCELSLAFLREDLTADDANRGVRRLKAGSVEIEYLGSAPAKSLPDVVSGLLRPYLAVDRSVSSIPMAL